MYQIVRFYFNENRIKRRVAPKSSSGLVPPCSGSASNCAFCHWVTFCKKENKCYIILILVSLDSIYEGQVFNPSSMALLNPYFALGWNLQW
jgi:hypothetical protein